MMKPFQYFTKWPVLPLPCRSVLILPIIIAAIHAGQASPTDDYRCPESYATDAERDTALKAFVKKFSQEHPQASIGDLLAERHRQLVAHACQQTLVNIEENRKAELTKPQFVSSDMRRLTLAGHNFERVDEYYDPRTRVWSVFFVDEPAHPESYSNQLVLNFYDWTPKPTAEAVASALSEPRQGTKNIFLFKFPDKPNGEMVYRIICLMLGNAYFLDLMNVTRWENSAVNIAFGHRLVTGVDLDSAEREARQWLLSSEGEALHQATARLRVGQGWREHLKRVK